MTWTAPATATTGNTLTAAFWNAQVRDNMLETAAASAAAAGDIVYADAANSMGSVLSHPGQSRMLVSDASNGLAWRQPAEDINFSDGSTSDFHSETSYTVRWGTADLPSVTATTGTAAIVLLKGLLSNDTAGSLVALSFSVSGATTISAADERAIIYESSNANDRAEFGGGTLLTTLTAGSNTFQAEARVDAGTGTITRPRILVIPL